MQERKLILLGDTSDGVGNNKPIERFGIPDKDIMDLSKKDLNTKIVEELYTNFLKDDTHLEAVRRQGLGWLAPGFIIELFVADLTNYAPVVITDDSYIRYTGIAKILSASPYNESPRSEIKAGDIVLTTDAMANIRISEDWTQYEQLKKSPQYKGVEPVKHLRWVHNWMNRGALFSTDRFNLILNLGAIKTDEKAVNEFRGPYIYKVESHEVSFKIDNPFGV